MNTPPAGGEDDPLQAQLAKELSQLLNGAPDAALLNVPPCAHLGYCLERFFPRVLRSRYPEWAMEALDGVLVARGRKTGRASAEFVGTCVLMREQTVTPFAVELELAEGQERVAVRRLNLGEMGNGRLHMATGPAANSTNAQRLLVGLVDRLDTIAWAYMMEEELGQVQA